jgi:molybdenum cofactor cytidylyltransferase
MGCAKLLLEYEGEPLICRTAKTALAAGFAPVVVVTGAYDEALREVLAGLPVEVVTNSHWEQGQASSLVAGVWALRTSAVEGVVILVADQPFVSAAHLQTMVDKFEQACLCLLQTPRPLVATAVGMRWGNPALFPVEYFDELESLQGDRGARGLFAKYPVAPCPSLDDRIFLDIDTPEDFEHLTGAGEQ